MLFIKNKTILDIVKGVNMTSVQPVSQNNEYKKHYIKPSGIAASAGLGALYGVTRGLPITEYMDKVLFPLDHKLEGFLSKKEIGKKFIELMKKGHATDPSQMVDLTKILRFNKEPGQYTTIYKLDKALAAKGALLMVGIYAAAKMVKKGIDYVLYDRHRS